MAISFATHAHHTRGVRRIDVRRTAADPSSWTPPDPPRPRLDMDISKDIFMDISMDYPWHDDPWIIHGSSMDYPRIIHG